MKLITYLSQQSRAFLLGLGFSLIALLGVLDYATGAELSFSIFYLLPIALLAWFTGRLSGLVASAAGAFAWLLADLIAAHAYTHPAMPYWNALTRFGIFAIMAYILSSLRTVGERQEELTQFIVHDLRSPLGNVMTGLQLLRDLPDKAPTERHTKLLEMCLSSSNGMLMLINSLLDAARLERGHMTPQRQEVTAAALVTSAIEQIGLWAKHNNVAIVTDLPATPLLVHADPTMATRVLTNLLSNAIKFSAPGSTVRVRVASQASQMVAFSIADEGYGVPEEWVDKVFDKFSQVTLRKTKGGMGSGLGLAFCRLAVEAQQGSIWLDSEVDKGTTVTFTLPPAHQETPQPAPTASP